MSYCVNCGVELSQSAKKCALCDTPVYNPNIAETEKEPLSPFSHDSFIPQELSLKAKKRLSIAVITAILFIPCLVCLALNLTFFTSGFWSVGVISACLFCWLAFVFPFICKKPRPYVFWAVDSLMLIVNAFVFSLLFKALTYKLLVFLLPLEAVVIFTVLSFMLWAGKKQRHILLILAFIFLGTAVCSLAAGGFLSVSMLLSPGIKVGIVAFSCLGAISLFFFYCYSSKTIRRWASKRVFI